MYLRLTPNLLHFLPDLGALYALCRALNFHESHPKFKKDRFSTKSISFKNESFVVGHFFHFRAHLQRYNTKAFFDGDLPKHPDEAEGLLSEFTTKIPEDLYEQFEQEQISENKDKISSNGDPGNSWGWRIGHILHECASNC
jgi:hypothetical protein